MIRNLLFATAYVAVTTLLPSYAAEPVKNFPSKPARIIVGYAAGGGVDMAARLVGQGLGEHWNSTVVIDNRPGAAGGLGGESGGLALLASRAVQDAGDRHADPRVGMGEGDPGRTPAFHGGGPLLGTFAEFHVVRVPTGCDTGRCGPPGSRPR